MLFYILKRLFYMLITLFMVSIISFVIIQLPPGDYVTAYAAQAAMSGRTLDQTAMNALRYRYGLDLPIYQQYFKWMWDMLHGDFGMSLTWNRPVNMLLAERLPLTLIISLVTLFFVYALAIPIGIYSATHQYSVGDYSLTVLGFIGLAIPNFLLALILMIFFNKFFNLAIGGLFSPEYLDAPWSLGRIWDMIKHLPVPVIVIGTAGTAGLIRVMRGCLLDELRKQYVITARAKGVKERALLFKYPVRVAINPIISTIGWELPYLISGETITAIVLGLPTTGPLIYSALIRQDMYLAGSAIMILCFLTVVGTLLSDLLLVWVDPRIRYKSVGR